jgi:hypothetical protein
LIVSIITGGPQDYLSLQAESLREAATLVQTALGLYAKQHPDEVILIGTELGNRVALRFNLGTNRGNQPLDPATRADIDATT